MTEDETHHLRLMMLHEKEGRIEGRAKYHKLLYKYWEEEADESSLEFVTEERGPYDPGLSKAMQRYIDLGLVEIDDDEEPHEIEETEKGRRYMSGYERTKMRLDEAFSQTRERISNTVNRHGDRSANDMVQDEDVQEAKNNPFRKEIE